MPFKFADLLPFRLTNIPGPDKADIAALAAQDGFDVLLTPDGKPVPVPKNLDTRDVQTFVTRWANITSPENASYTAVNRDHRVKMYEIMDASGASGGLILDTYADEALNVTNADNRAISVHVKYPDNTIKQGIADVLRAYGVIENAHSDIRSMCKYGDSCYAVHARSTLPYQITEEQMMGNVLESTHHLRPSDIVLEFLPGKTYGLAAYKDRIFKLTKNEEFDNTTARYDYFAKRQDMMPWEFALFSLKSRETFPYGSSILEKCRIPYEQLGALESLLAITRANHIDRIGVGVPGLGGVADPASLMAKLSNLKNTMKNVILGPAGNVPSRYSRNQDIGLTEMFFYPENFDVKKLETAHDLAHIDDVEYFRDNFYNASRLPKGYFLADKVTDRGYALRQQDIKFARSVLPVARAYAEGLERLCFLIGFYLGANIEDLEVKVRIQQSSYLSLDLIKSYGAAFELITGYVNVQKLSNPDYTLPEVQLHRMLVKAGIPMEFFSDSKTSKEFTDKLIQEAKEDVRELLEELMANAAFNSNAHGLCPKSLAELCIV